MWIFSDFFIFANFLLDIHFLLCVFSVIMVKRRSKRAAVVAASKAAGAASTAGGTTTDESAQTSRSTVTTISTSSSANGQGDGVVTMAQVLAKLDSVQNELAELKRGAGEMTSHSAKRARQEEEQNSQAELTPSPPPPRGIYSHGMPQSSPLGSSVGLLPPWLHTYMNQPGATTNDLMSTGQPIPLSHLPAIDIVPEHIRRQVLQGKDINLAILLLPLNERRHAQQNRDITVAGETIQLKPLKDARLNKMLTIQEFVKAFTIYKTVMCEQFPNRLKELDTYMSHIIDLSNKFPGSSFYDYHLEVSARSASFLEKGIRVDWSVLDEKLLTMIVAGRKANTCHLCHAFDHDSRFCHLAASANDTRHQKNRNSTPCRHYNSHDGCNYPQCRFKHVCGTCNSPGHRSLDRQKCNLAHKPSTISS